MEALMSEPLYPILGKGEYLTGPVELAGGGVQKKDIRDFDAGRERLLPQLEELTYGAHSIPDSNRISRGVYFCLDLDSSYIAKSYYPRQLINTVNWELVGSIAWDQDKRDGSPITKKQSRRLYFRGTPESISDTHNALHQANSLSNQIKKEIVRIDSIHLMDSTSSVDRLNDISEGVLVELIIHSMLESDWQECLYKLKSIISSKDYPDFLFDWIRGGTAKSPRFIPAQVSKEIISQLGQFNPLRSFRVMPEISIPRINTGELIDLGPLPQGDALRVGEIPEIGVFDGGVDQGIPHLGMWVVSEDITPESKEEAYLEHGTAVCGAVLYGNYDPGKQYESPPIMVKSFRIFPVPNVHGFNLDLYQILEWIEKAVDHNPQIKTFVLSFGPDFPIEDNEIDPFTTTLDRLAYEKDVLFVVAAGNKGKLSPPYNRIQPPSDIINGLGVGAYMQDLKGDFIPASYSCIGPGRCGNAIKPDVHAFGGDIGQPFNVFLAGAGGKCTGVMGTSFAAPVVSSVVGNLIYRVDDHQIITPQTAKALLIHNANKCEGWDPNYGWGAMFSTPDEIMTCTDSSVVIIYNGEIDFKKCIRLKIPFFSDAIDKGYVTFRWTFVFATGIAPGMPDEYSLAGTDISFRPNANVYTYTLKGKSIGNADIFNDSQKVVQFEKQGAKRSLHQRTKSPNRNEQQRRDEGVWDTVEHCWTKMLVTGVHDPCLDIHALARSDWEYGPETPGKIRYAAVISIEFSRPEARLYQLIRTRIPELIPVRLTNRARLRT